MFNLACVDAFSPPSIIYLSEDEGNGRRNFKKIIKDGNLYLTKGIFTNYRKKQSKNRLTLSFFCDRSLRLKKKTHSKNLLTLTH